MEKVDINAHKEWVEKVSGTKTSEISTAKPMPGMEYIPLDGLVVSDEVKDWENIKQPIIPVKPSADGSDASSRARGQLMNMRAQTMSNNSFLALVKDEKMGGEEQWSLSIIRPDELSLSEEQIKDGMEASYMTGQLVLGSASRATYLAKTGKTNV